MRHVLFTLEEVRQGPRAVERFGVLLSKVRTVVMPRPLSRVPRAPPAMLGIMNLRGRVVSVVDLALLLGRPGRSPGRILVLDRGRTELGLAVSEVMGTAPLEADARLGLESPPFIASVAQDPMGAVTLLDTEALDAHVASLFGA